MFLWRGWNIFFLKILKITFSFLHFLDFLFELLLPLGLKMQHDQNNCKNTENCDDYVQFYIVLSNTTFFVWVIDIEFVTPILKVSKFAGSFHAAKRQFSHFSIIQNL